MIGLQASYAPRKGPSLSLESEFEQSWADRAVLTAGLRDTLAPISLPFGAAVV